MSGPPSSSESPEAETAKARDDAWIQMLQGLGTAMRVASEPQKVQGWARVILARDDAEDVTARRLGILFRHLGRSLWIATSPGHTPEEEQQHVEYCIALAREVHRIETNDALADLEWHDAYSDAAEAAGIDPKYTRRDRALVAARRAQRTDPELRRRLYEEELARGEAILRAEEEQTDGK